MKLVHMLNCSLCFICIHCRAPETKPSCPWKISTGKKLKKKFEMLQLIWWLPILISFSDKLCCLFLQSIRGQFHKKMLSLEKEYQQALSAIQTKNLSQEGGWFLHNLPYCLLLVYIITGTTKTSVWVSILRIKKGVAYGMKNSTGLITVTDVFSDQFIMISLISNHFYPIVDSSILFSRVNAEDR